MIPWKYKNIKIWKYTNIHLEKWKCKNVEEYVKKVNIFIKNCKVTSNRNVEPNKERIYKSNKYIETRIQKYMDMQTWK